MNNADIPRVNLKTIDEALKRFFTSLAKGEVKVIVSDALRLLELRKQLAQDEIREVKVKWVEPKPAPFVIKI
jgi:hypothetical protein